MKKILLVFLSLFSIVSIAQRAKMPDQGDVKVVWKNKIKNQDFRTFQEYLKKEKVLDIIASDINSYLALSENLYITFDECGKETAFYDADQKRVTICYEMVAYLYDLFKSEADDEKELEEMVINTTMFIFYHEIGHALIDLLELPMIGKEEDAVDNFSVFLLADGSRKGTLAILDGATAFYLMGEQSQDTRLKNLPLWGEHSLDHQRFYNILCMLYGANPKLGQEFISHELLPKEATFRCLNDYKKIEKSWLKILDPWIRK